MDVKKIMRFLTDVTQNNNRPWFQEHKGEYEEAKREFEGGIEKAIGRLIEMDESISHIGVKDSVYRFYRDTRFSPDKSPYKRHFGAYIAAHGKKALHGGYYIHLQPGHCMLAIGSYWLPTNILTSCRNEIMANIDDWRKAVENPAFVELFGKPEDVAALEEGDEWPTSDKGFGIVHLKTAPAGFPRDYEFIQYLRMKDYCCWKIVPDSFFEDDRWLDEMARIFKTGKPMMDFINNVIDDYE